MNVKKAGSIVSPRLGTVLVYKIIGSAGKVKIEKNVIRSVGIKIGHRFAFTGYIQTTAGLFSALEDKENR
jgi:hypothetical protein